MGQEKPTTLLLVTIAACGKGVTITAEERRVSSLLHVGREDCLASCEEGHRHKLELCCVVLCCVAVAGSCKSVKMKHNTSKMKRLGLAGCGS